MTDIKSAFPHPPQYVNRYLWNALKQIDPTLSTKYGSVVPFFPLADSRAGDAGWGNKPYLVYDILFRFRQTRFYPIHRIQIIYFIRGQADEALGWTTAIASILDRGDASAQDINTYLAQNEPNAGIYFHNTKAFMVDTSNNERLDLSVRQYYTETLIIEIDYHITKDNGFN